MMVVEQLKAIVGAQYVLTGEAAAPYLTDWRKTQTGRAHAVVKPADTQQTAAVVRLCAEHRIPIVPQGGNTGQVAGATPDGSGSAIVLHTGRMNRIREINPLNNTMVVEAGCVLQNVQEAARAADRLFPLSLGAEGSCFIGGNLATNAGGTQVLSYGNARELVLGLEVVLPSGEIWDGLRQLRKDNTGLSLRDLFVGSEGALGVITAAVLRLHPLPRAQHTVFLALPDFAAAAEVFQRARARFYATLTGFELISSACLTLVTATFPDLRSPFDTAEDSAERCYALLEIAEHEGADGTAEAVSDFCAQAWEAGLLEDAAVAASDTQRGQFWTLRESITLALAKTGYCVKHDISLPISAIPGFVAQNTQALATAFPQARLMMFGHLGDGNLHYNVLLPDDVSAAWASLETDIQACVHDHVVRLGGSISAEQGIGSKRVQDLERYKSPLELRLMRAIKQAVDPQGIMNPGKLIP